MDQRNGREAAHATSYIRTYLRQADNKPNGYMNPDRNMKAQNEERMFHRFRKIKTNQILKSELLTHPQKIDQTLTTCNRVRWAAKKIVGATRVVLSSPTTSKPAIRGNGSNAI